MGTIQIHSRLDQEGVLTLRVPLSPDDANAEVTVTIQPTPPFSDAAQSSDWDKTYGSCAGLGLEEPADLPLQKSEWAQ